MIIYTFASLGIIYFMNGCQKQTSELIGKSTEDTNSNSDVFVKKPTFDVMNGILPKGNGKTKAFNEFAGATDTFAKPIISQTAGLKGQLPVKDISASTLTGPFIAPSLSQIGTGYTLNAERAVRVRVKDTSNEHFCLEFNSPKELEQMNISLNNNDEKILFIRTMDAVKQCKIKLDAKFVRARSINRSGGFIPGQMVTGRDLQRNLPILMVSDNIQSLQLILRGRYRGGLEKQLDSNNKIAKNDLYVSWDNLLQ